MNVRELEQHQALCEELRAARERADTNEMYRSQGLKWQSALEKIGDAVNSPMFATLSKDVLPAVERVVEERNNLEARLTRQSKEWESERECYARKYRDALQHSQPQVTHVTGHTTDHLHGMIETHRKERDEARRRLWDLSSLVVNTPYSVPVSGSVLHLTEWARNTRSWLTATGFRAIANQEDQTPAPGEPSPKERDTAAHGPDAGGRTAVSHLQAAATSIGEAIKLLIAERVKREPQP